VTDLRTSPLTPEATARVLAVIDAHAAALGLPFDGEPLSVEAWEGETWLGGLTARTHQNGSSWS
jgi:hypothetical protein